MDLKQIEYFFSIAEVGNITKAADLLYTSQPTVSRQLLILERELGYPLFNRDSKPLELTKAGKIFYDGMKDALSKIDTTVDIAKNAAEENNNSLSIAFQSGYYTEYILFPVIDAFREAYPNIHIRSDKLMSIEMMNGLKNESIDICIGRAFKHWLEAGFDVQELQKIDTQVIMSNKHRLAAKKSLNYTDLQGETFYLTSPNGHQINEIFQGHCSLSQVNQVQVPNSEIAYFKVLAYNGLTLSDPYDPSWTNNPYYHSISISPFYTDSCVCVTTPTNLNPTIKLFKDFFTDFMQ
ncbi:LysR family transcriptional regulator [Agrilactobacillus yilanensis]|uniref:LysR family transcriptional regulator n=1 Tax=Agrilactobacillus yilanensis TaxID=2485997 RepID=A0ABW4J7G8_9LACO|nr:LysR family transcriptional regulator [Agrilactobacillus yilanensis]